LEQVSHIRYRLSKTDEYVQEQKKINNRDFMVFTKRVIGMKRMRLQ
jgi:hypothetical protein